MNLKLKIAAAALLFSAGLQAQTIQGDPSAPKGRSCATPVPSSEWDAWFNNKVEELKRDRAAGKTQTTVYTIPVIVHVIAGNQAIGTYPNISQAQINSQITVLNNDFAGTGLNVGNLANTAFSSIGAADCQISFCLAEVDPLGNQLVEPGIDRVNYITQGWTNPATPNTQATFQSLIDNTIKPNTIWDPTRYFNIWVTDHHNNVDLLGYATFPVGTGLTGIFNGNGNANNDGVWVWSRAFGNTGTLFPPYNQGRTATHEIGHWLGLRHIGGDGNNNAAGDCNATDYCNDTPPQKGGFSGGAYGQNFGSPNYPLYASGPNACASSPNGCMFMNFMDYVDDVSCYMFTPDQSTRMITAMNNGTFRNQLTASSATACGAPATMPTAAFQAPATVCLDSAFVVTNQSSGSPAPSYSWSISPPFPGAVQFLPNSVAATPTIVFNTAFTFSLVMTANNAAGTTTAASVISINACTGVGIGKNSSLENKVALFPNPSAGILNISTVLSGNEDLDVMIHNYLGQYVTSASYKDVASGTYSLDLSGYANGVYFVSLSSGQDKVVKRLILNK